MKTIMAVLTDINSSEHVAALTSLPDAPTTIKQGETLLCQLKWIKVQDDRMLNMEHVLSFKIVEQ